MNYKIWGFFMSACNEIIVFHYYFYNKIVYYPLEDINMKLPSD
jgi:hypothetical protein